MTRGVGEIERDEELSKLLARWAAPPLPEGMDERVLAAYRKRTSTAAPWWERLFTSSVHLPLPVAVGLLMLFIVTAVLALRPTPAPPTAGTAGPSAPVQAAQSMDPPVVTRTSLAGFEPVSEVTATVLPETREIRQ
jgi:hypothetical protein